MDDTQLLEKAPPARLDIPIVRLRRDEVALRKADDETQMPEMFGHFSVFGNWYEINSYFEGHFLEQVSPGAFRKTFRENFDNIRVLLEHGMDLEVNEKPLGKPLRLEEDKIGAYFETSLYASEYVQQLVPALEDGQYGSSFRFEVIKDEWDNEPERSEHNPDGIPERTITEVRTFEFGPTIWPANPEATSGIRSATDEHYEITKQRQPERYTELLRRVASSRTSEPGGTGAAEAHLDILQDFRRRRDELGRATGAHSRSA